MASSCRSAREGRDGITAQGHPRVTFNRAIERGDLAVAEPVLCELGRPSLVEFLDLTALIAEKDVGGHGRVAARWLFKYFEARDDATIEDEGLVAACLTSSAAARRVVSASRCRHGFLTTPDNW